MNKGFGLLSFWLVLSAVCVNDVWAKNWNTTSEPVLAREHVGKVDIKFPKYFFSDVLNPSCKMKGKHEDRSFQQKGSPLELDLRDKDNFQWMEELKDYSWQRDHDQRSDSLSVYSEELTNRMNFLNATLDNAIIDRQLAVQAPLGIQLLRLYAENTVILDSTSIPEIKNMPKSQRRCYRGKGDTAAVCHWHTAQEASRFSGQLTIAAIKLKPFMTSQDQKIIDSYLEKLFKKYSLPWQKNHLAKWRDSKVIGFYQMGYGSFSVLAYAAYTNDRKLAKTAFSQAINYIDKRIFADGLIVNNSFRGVRGFWYHTLGLNNILGLLALADQWNYPVSDSLRSRVKKSVEQMELGATDIKKYEQQWYSRLNLNDFSIKHQSKKFYIGDSSFKSKDARPHIHQQAPFIDYLAKRYTSADTSFFSEKLPGVLIWKRKKKYHYYDRMLGFNPTCIFKSTSYSSPETENQKKNTSMDSGNSNNSESTISEVLDFYNDADFDQRSCLIRTIGSSDLWMMFKSNAKLHSKRLEERRLEAYKKCIGS